MPEWFRRFGDIPGVHYTSGEQIERDALPGCDDVPEVHAFRVGDQSKQTLSWPVGEGSRGGSASSAHYRAFSAFRDKRDASAEGLLRNLSEGLELPGEPSDYHFLIQSCVDELWRRCRKEPDLVGEVERLCWLDIGLIRALITGAPYTYDRILAFAKDENRPGPRHIELNPHAISDQIATVGAFYIVRRRRTWPEPAAAECPTCGKDFWNGDIRPWAIKAFGPVRYCMDCCFRVRNGDPRATWFEQEVKDALHELRDAFGAIPAQGFAAGRVPHDGLPEGRDRRIRALLAMPPVETIKRVLGQPDWLETLRAAGLVGETWRPSRGTWCHADDGHRCRSLLEKAIDDWFTTNSIPHECEPRWPRHPALNPSGAKRADWLLPDGTYVECAGMLESRDYAEKIALKQELAKVLGLPLIVVGPTDMHRLGRIFAGQVEGGLLGDPAALAIQSPGER